MSVVARNHPSRDSVRHGPGSCGPGSRGSAWRGSGRGDAAWRGSGRGDAGRRESGRGDAECGQVERGAGTVLVLGIIGAVLLLALGIAALGAAQNARGTAQAAADLGALAGATALRDGFDPCGTAGAAVARNGAEIASCEVLGGGMVRVVTTRAAIGPGGELASGLGQARASARAGPRVATGG